jgi:ferredoxin
LACSTCHVIVDKDYYKKLPDPSDEEDDMLDLAFGLTETSRLGCQIKMNAEIDGITVRYFYSLICRIPNATRNVQQEKLH